MISPLPSKAEMWYSACVLLRMAEVCRDEVLTKFFVTEKSVTEKSVSHITEKSVILKGTVPI